MNNKKNIKFYYRKNGNLIEFIKWDKYFFSYLIKRIMSFFVDILLYISFILIFKMLVGFSLISSFIIVYFVFFLYIWGITFLLKNKTLGMLIAGLQIGLYDGSPLIKNRILIRSTLTSLYTIPILGWTLLITSFLSIIFNKGLTPVDLFSKTQVFTKYFHNKTIRIFANIQKEGDNGYY